MDMLIQQELQQLQDMFDAQASQFDEKPPPSVETDDEEDEIMDAILANNVPLQQPFGQVAVDDQPRIIGQEQAPPRQEGIPDNEPPEDMLVVRVVSGRGFPRNSKALQPDIYCSINYGTWNDEPWRTTTVLNSSRPIWPEDEEREFYLDDGEDLLSIHVRDEDNNKLLGQAYLTVNRFQKGKLIDIKLHRPDIDTTSRSWKPWRSNSAFYLRIHCRIREADFDV